MRTNLSAPRPARHAVLKAMMPMRCTANIAGQSCKLQEVVVCYKWRELRLYRPPKGVSVDTPAKDNVMHVRRCRETDRLAAQALHTRPSCQGLALDLLRVPFARALDVGVQMPGVGAPRSVEERVSPKGSSSAVSFRKTSSLRRPKT